MGGVCEPSPVSYRGFVVSPTDGAGLHSPYSLAPVVAGWTKATCAFEAHAAPAPGCLCGWYVADNLAAAAAWWLGWGDAMVVYRENGLDVTEFDHVAAGWIPVLAEVSTSGRTLVDQHQGVFGRARAIKVLRVWLPREAAGLAAAIKDAYDAEIVTCDADAYGAIQQLGQEFGADPTRVGCLECSDPDGHPVCAMCLSRRVAGLTAAPSAERGGYSDTGERLGVRRRAYVVSDRDGARWVVKHYTAPAGDAAFLSVLDFATARLQELTGLPAAETKVMTMGSGRRVSLQRMFNAEPAFPGGFRAEQVTPADLLVLQKHQVFDWFLGNHDAHEGNFIRIRDDGSVVGIDKSQSFRFYAKDRLYPHYQPSPLTLPPTVYSPLWRAFARSHIELLDPARGELAEYIAAVENLDEKPVRALLRPMALL